MRKPCRCRGQTVLRLPIAAPAVLALRRHEAEWRIEPQRQAPPARSLALEIEAGPPVRLALRAAAPGRVVPLADPDTGLPLLVATVGEAGQAMPLPRRLPQAELLPTTLGAAVLVRDDRLRLSRRGGPFPPVGGRPRPRGCASAPPASARWPMRRR